MVRTILLCVAILSVAISTYASTGGSPYSIFGIGDIRYLPNTRSAGMGYANLGLASGNFINSMQPASWSRINRVRLETGVLYEGFKSSDASKSLYLANSDFSGALLGIPISPANGIVTVLGFTPYSNVNYNLFETGSQEGIDYHVNQSGTGGLSRGLLGLSYAAFTDLALGASLNYLFGTVDNSSQFSPTNTAYAGALTTQSSTMHGVTVTFGAQFNGFGRINESLKPLSLGLVVSTRSYLRTERQTRYEFLAERDTLASVKGTMIVPPAYGIGLGYQVSERYVIAADYYAQPWGNATFNGIDPAEIRNSSRFGIGGERLPNRDATAWFARLVYRLGFYYNSTYYKINNEPVNEWGITSGVAIPLFGDAKLNTAFEYGSRGTTRNGLVKDNVFRLSFSVTLSEIWFQQYEEE